MPKISKLKLSISILLQTLIFGSFLPIVSSYLQDFLKYSGKESGWVMSARFIASVASVIFTIFIVDKKMKKKNLLFLFYILGGITLILLSFQKAFLPFLVLYTLGILFLTPTVGLLNAIIFHSISGDEKAYSKIRIWGVIGWISVGWVMGFLWIEIFGDSHLPDLFRFAGIISIISAFFTYKVLQTADQIEKPEKTPALTVIKDLLKSVKIPGIKLVFVILFMGEMFLVIYYFGIGPNLSQLGIKQSLIMPILSIAQFFELLTLGLMNTILKKYKLKSIFIFSFFLQMIVFVMLSLSAALGLVSILAAVSFQGIIFGIFLSSIYILADKFCSTESRSNIHLLVVITSGTSSFAASHFAGAVIDQFTEGTVKNYIPFWLIFIVVSFAALAFVFFAFNKIKLKKAKDDGENEEPEPSVV